MTPFYSKVTKRKLDQTVVLEAVLVLEAAPDQKLVLAIDFNFKMKYFNMDNVEYLDFYKEADDIRKKLDDWQATF